MYTMLFSARPAVTCPVADCAVLGMSAGVWWTEQMIGLEVTRM